MIDCVKWQKKTHTVWSVCVHVCVGISVWLTCELYHMLKFNSIAISCLDSKKALLYTSSLPLLLQAASPAINWTHQKKNYSLHKLTHSCVLYIICLLLYYEIRVYNHWTCIEFWSVEWKNFCFYSTVSAKCHLKDEFTAKIEIFQDEWNFLFWIWIEKKKFFKKKNNFKFTFKLW